MTEHFHYVHVLATVSPDGHAIYLVLCCSEIVTIVFHLRYTTHCVQA